MKEEKNQMENNKCPNKAMYILPWAGKLMKMCAIHANGLCAIANAIGAPIQVELLLSDEDCMGVNDLDQYKEEEDNK